MQIAKEALNYSQDLGDYQTTETYLRTVSYINDLTFMIEGSFSVMD